MDRQPLQPQVGIGLIFGRSITYRGTQGTAILGFFDRTAAMTGASEKALRRANRPFRKVYVHPAHHAGYYPGAEAMTLKLLFDPTTGQVLGAQAVGGAGVDKRIDVLAVAIQAKMTVFDLEEMELAYAPQFGSAKDPINMAGFVAWRASSRRTSTGRCRGGVSDSCCRETISVGRSHAAGICFRPHPRSRKHSGG